jgi:hypothetical protein
VQDDRGAIGGPIMWCAVLFGLLLVVVATILGYDRAMHLALIGAGLEAVVMAALCAAWWI